MKKQRTNQIKQYLILLLTMLFAVMLIVSFLVGLQNTPAAVKIKTDVGTDGISPITTVSISDLSELGTLSHVNFTRDKYLTPQSQIGGDIIQLTTASADKSAIKGTYEFVLLNLEPYDQAFKEKSSALSPYLFADNYWHFTMYIPANFSACSVYINTELVAQRGVMSGYNISDYCDYRGEIISPTVHHKGESEPLFINLKFYSRRQAIPAGKPLLAAQTVTIHFEAEPGKQSGLVGIPLIGSDKEVRNAVTRDKNVLTSALIISAISLAVFIFLCILKRSLSFLPQLLIALGVLGFFLSTFAMTSATHIPYFWTAMGRFSFAFILPTSLLSLRVKIGNFPLWLPFALFAFLNCILAFTSPLCAFGLSSAYAAYSAIAAVIMATIIILFAIYRVYRFGKPAESINPLLAATTTIAAIFLPLYPLNVVTPILWLFIAMILVTIILSFRIFIGLERSNVYLTANLQDAVTRQTKDLQAVLDERDNLLRHVSHDLKKPVTSMQDFLCTLRYNEKDCEQLKTLDIIARKANELSKTLTELSGFSKLNFVTEQSSCADVDEIVFSSFIKLEPDCSANGIVLIYSRTNIRAFCKRNALESVITNLIINALEHADCNTITLAICKKKHACYITVTDNGKGIPDGRDVFKPYYSENDNANNLGLGLYLCKSLITSMGGNLYYTQEYSKLTFTITLPLA